MDLKRAAFLLTICSFVLCSCQQEMEKTGIRPVRAMQIKKEETIAGRTFPGRVRAVDRVNLSFRVDGPLIELPIQVGDAVNKGDLIAKIDPLDYSVELDNVTGRLETAKANLRFAESDYARAQRIREEDPGAISESSVDKKREERNRLQGEVRSLQAQVDAAQNALNYTEMRAPYDGTVVAKYVDNYEFVRAKEPVVRLLNTSKVEMVIDVPENMVIYLPYVTNLTVSIDAYPGRSFPATVKEIGTEASQITGTYPITLLIEQAVDAQILAGMSGEATAIAKNIEEIGQSGYLVPISALFSDKEEGISYVWIIDTDKQTVHRRQVEKGALNNKGILIEKGVKPGEWIAVSGVNFLHDGQEVRIQAMQLNANGELTSADNITTDQRKKEEAAEPVTI